MGKYLYIFLHIPKTGGSTFRKHIEKNFSEEERLLIAYHELRFNKKAPTKSDFTKAFKKDFSKLSPRRKEKIKIIYGHEIPYGVHEFFQKPSRYIIFVRNPLKRALSLYNFFRTRYERETTSGRKRRHYKYQLLVGGKIPNFEKWLDTKFGISGSGVETTQQHLKSLGYLKGLKTKNVKRMFEKFYFVGITQNLDRDMNYLFDEMSINRFFVRQNVSTKYVKKPSMKELKIIKEKTEISSYIFEEAKKQRKNFINEHSEYFKKTKITAIKRILILPFTQVIFDFKGTLISISDFIKRNSKLYAKYWPILRSKI